MKKIVLKNFPGIFFYWEMIGFRFLGLVLISALLGFTESFSLGLLLPIFEGFLKNNDSQFSQVFNDNQILSAITHWVPVEINIKSILILFVIFMLLKSVFKYSVLNYSWSLIANMNFRVRQKLIKAMINLDYRAYTRLETGKITSALTVEVERCMGGFQYFVNYVCALFTGLAFVLILVWINYMFSFTIIIMGILYYMVFRKLASQVKKFSQQITHEAGRFNSLLIQVFQSFKYIKAAAFYIPFSKRLISSIWEMRTDKLKIMKRQGLLIVLQELSLMTLLIAAFFINVKYFNADFASILLSVMLFYRASGYILNSQAIWSNYVSLAGGTQSVIDNIKKFENNREAAFGVEFPHFEAAIKIQNVSFSFGKNRKILDNISLEIRKNTTIAFVGKSGSGKSTLVNLLTGLLRPDQGKIFIDDLCLEDVDIDSWRKKIGYVTQEPILFTDSVENNITMWSDSSAENQLKLDAAIKNAHIDEFIDSIGGQTRMVGDKGVFLSGGQRQRISIGREFFKNPDLLIFDEATSSLDAESETFIQNSIDDNKGKTTTIIIAHRLSTIRNADTIFMLSNGRIVEQGSFDELMKNKNSSFAEFVRLQTV